MFVKWLILDSKDQYTPPDSVEYQGRTPVWSTSKSSPRMVWLLLLVSFRDDRIDTVNWWLTTISWLLYIWLWHTMTLDQQDMEIAATDHSLAASPAIDNGVERATDQFWSTSLFQNHNSLGRATTLYYPDIGRSTIYSWNSPSFREQKQVIPYSQGCQVRFP